MRSGGMDNLNPYFLPAVFIIILLFVVAVGVLVFRIINKSHAQQIASYERLLVQADEKYIDLLGRVHATKNISPPGVDLKQEHEDRKKKEQSQQVERRNGGALTRPIGAVDAAQELMVRDVRQEITNS
jgi:hypothetical protein